MKTISSIILVFIIVVNYNCTTNSKKLTNMPQAMFLKDTFDFKKIEKGAIVDVSFSVKNIGPVDVLIKNSSVGCGCTKVKSIKDNIIPGETVDLKLVYDSKSDSGIVLKTFVVETNTNPKLHVLYIKGIVE